MNNKRWIKVSREQRNASRLFVGTEPLVAAYDAAAGQRVKTIRWCETHDDHESDRRPGECWKFYFGRVDDRCRIVTATLILPPEEQT